MPIEQSSNGQTIASGPRGPRRHIYGPFIPIVLLAVAFVAWLGFQGWQLVAEQGNANARVVVGELRRRGVTINPDGSAKRQ